MKLRILGGVNIVVIFRLSRSTNDFMEIMGMDRRIILEHWLSREEVIQKLQAIHIGGSVKNFVFFGSGVRILLAP